MRLTTLNSLLEISRFVHAAAICLNLFDFHKMKERVVDPISSDLPPSSSSSLSLAQLNEQISQYANRVEGPLKFRARLVQ